MPVKVVLDGDGEERRYRRPFDRRVAAALLEALGVRGVVSVTACWVGQDSWYRKSQYVCALCRDTWRFGGRDSGVPVERAFRLVAVDGAWRLAGVARVLPNELDAVFELWERCPRPSRLLGEAEEVALEAAGEGDREPDAGSPEWDGFRVEAACAR